MTSFHDFWLKLDGHGRQAYAQKVGTTAGYLEKVAYGGAAPSLDMLYRMTQADRRVTFLGVHATWSQHQERRRAKASRLAQ